MSFIDIGLISLYYEKRERKDYIKEDRIRFMFEINPFSGTPFRDMYVSHNCRHKKGSTEYVKPTGFDFPGLEGYRGSLKSQWYYQAVNPVILSPQGTPIAFSCSINPRYNEPISYSEGSCRTHMVFDQHLRAQIRFNMSLLKDWEQFYTRAMVLINQYRQHKDKKGEEQ